MEWGRENNEYSPEAMENMQNIYQGLLDFGSNAADTAGDAQKYIAGFYEENPEDFMEILLNAGAFIPAAGQLSKGAATAVRLARAAGLANSAKDWYDYATRDD